MFHSPNLTVQVEKRDPRIDALCPKKVVTVLVGNNRAKLRASANHRTRHRSALVYRQARRTSRRPIALYPHHLSTSISDGRFPFTKLNVFGQASGGSVRRRVLSLKVFISVCCPAARLRALLEGCSAGTSEPRAGCQAGALQAQHIRSADRVSLNQNHLLGRA